ncbi:MAG: IS200/IS605 family transposase [Gemmatimonadales bacterium]
MRDRIYLHVAWTTRDRSPVIDRRVAEFLCQFLPIVCRQERAQLLEMGVVATHVHLLIRVHPTTALPRLVQRLKGGSSVSINRERGMPTTLRWAKGYSINSVGERALESARSYVRNQDKRHPVDAIEGWDYGGQFTDISRAVALATK